MNRVGIGWKPYPTKITRAFWELVCVCVGGGGERKALLYVSFEWINYRRVLWGRKLQFRRSSRIERKPNALYHAVCLVNKFTNGIEIIQIQFHSTATLRIFLIRSERNGGAGPWEWDIRAKAQGQLDDDATFCFAKYEGVGRHFCKAVYKGSYSVTDQSLQA